MKELREDEEGDVSSYSTTFRKRKDKENGMRKQQIASCVEMEEAMDQS